MSRPTYVPFCIPIEHSDKTSPAEYSPKVSLLSRRSVAFFGIGGLAAIVAGNRGRADPKFPQRNRKSVGGIHQSLLIDVTQFGALADGVSDDAHAINLAIQAAHDQHTMVGQIEVDCRIYFPTGVYVIGSSINLTNMRGISTVVDGSGSVLVGRCAGQPVIDALGARWLMLRDLTIISDSAYVPTVGLQIGVISEHLVADDHRFENLKIVGNYTLACLYNRGAETTGFDHVLLWNKHPNSYCLIQDGTNHFDVRSSFIHVDIPQDKSLSFNENEFINCDFRHSAGGSPVWMGDTSRHIFIRCYSATTKGPSFIIFCGSNSHSMLDIDCHCESDGLENVFRFESKGKTIRICGFSYRDHTTCAKLAVFSLEPNIVESHVEHARIEIAGYRSEECRLFDNPKKWAMTGTYYSAHKGAWNGDSAFIGTLYSGGKVIQLGNIAAKVAVGLTSNRPLGLGTADEGTLFLDKSLAKLIVWSTNGWIDANGSPC